MVVLRSFALIFIVYAVVALEATISQYLKVGEKYRKKRKENKGKERNRKVRGQCPKVKGRLSVIVRC